MIQTLGEEVIVWILGVVAVVDLAVLVTIRWKQKGKPCLPLPHGFTGFH